MYSKIHFIFLINISTKYLPNSFSYNFKFYESNYFMFKLNYCFILMSLLLLIQLNYSLTKVIQFSRKKKYGFFFYYIFIFYKKKQHIFDILVDSCFVYYKLYIFFFCINEVIKNKYLNAMWRIFKKKLLFSTELTYLNY